MSRISCCLFIPLITSLTLHFLQIQKVLIFLILLNLLFFRLSLHCFMPLVCIFALKKHLLFQLNAALFPRLEIRLKIPWVLILGSLKMSMFSEMDLIVVWGLRQALTGVLWDIVEILLVTLLIAREIEGEINEITPTHLIHAIAQNALNILLSLPHSFFAALLLLNSEFHHTYSLTVSLFGHLQGNLVIVSCL
jgi:hypothetical protein